jgi:hypothetical protein
VAAKASQNPLTRRLGPLPVFGWLIVAVAAYFLYSHYKGSSTATAGTTLDSGTPGMFAAPTDQGGGGGSSGIPQLPIPAQQASQPATTSDPAADPAAASSSAAPAAAPMDTTAVATMSAPAAAPVEQGAPPGAAFPDGLASVATTDTATPWSYAATVSGGQVASDLPPELQIAGIPDNAYVIGGPAQVAPPNIFGNPATPFVSSQTPTLPPPQLPQGTRPQPGLAYVD